MVGAGMALHKVSNEHGENKQHLSDLNGAPEALIRATRIDAKKRRATTLDQTANG